MIVRLKERSLETKFGSFREILYYDGQVESIAIVMGEVEKEEDVLCRIHSSCISAHVFNSIECDCREQMQASQEVIQKEGKGIIIYLDQEGKGNGHLALMASIEYKQAGFSQSEAYEKAGFESDARSFRPAAEILEDLGVKSITLLTGSEKKAAGLRDPLILMFPARARSRVLSVPSQKFYHRTAMILKRTPASAFNFHR